MKSMITAVLLTLLTLPTFGETEIKIGDHVSLAEPDVQGFVRFIDKIDEYEIIALSTDIGSAVPSSDLRLYIEKEDEYKKVVALPLLTHKGYLCVKQDGKLKIFTTKSYEVKKPKDRDKPIISVDLNELIKMVEPEA